MPFGKKTILIAIIIALGFVAWGLTRGTEFSETKMQAIALSDEADKIKIKDGETAHTLIKDSGEWAVEDKGERFPSNEEAVKIVIDTLKDFKLKEIVSKSKDKYSAFGVDEAQALTVRWFKKDKEQGVIYIGGPDFRRGGDYVRLMKDAAVYVSENSIRSSFSKSSFKSLKLLAFDEDGIERIRWDYKDNKDDLAMKRATTKNDKGEEEKQWVFEDGKDEKADGSKVTSLLNMLSTHEARNAALYDKKQDYGFEEPLYVLTLESADGKKYELTAGRQMDEEPAYYAKTSGEDRWVYAVNIPFIEDEIRKTKDDFLAATGTASADEAQ